ncbi:hypothetical protein TWF481_002835 [Arthrobotrys musiformis]|uniref:Uncharacterized protein n=1 Tax=Arthrobotrys musiformis TaxID=47236 RepID=A0AAV9VRI4_9PEZI
MEFEIALTHARELAFDILSLFFNSAKNPSVQPHVHVWLVFLNYLEKYPEGIALVVKRFPWEKMARYGTALLKETNEAIIERIQDNETFPIAQNDPYPLPEEYLMRGLKITEGYCLDNYFDYKTGTIEQDEKLVERPSMSAFRKKKDTLAYS